MPEKKHVYNALRLASGGHWGRGAEGAPLIDL